VKPSIAVPCRLCWPSGARFLVPNIEAFRPDLSIDTGREQVSAGMEVTVNEGVGGEKVLGLPRRFEALHLPLSSSRRSM
jgi:hypothetical protein